MIVFYFIGSLVVLMVMVWTIITIYHDDLRLKAERSIDRKMNALVTFDHVSITLLTDFPNLTITLHDLVVTGRGEFEKDTLVTSDELALEIKTISVFSEGETEVKSMHLHHPSLSLKVSKDGQSNYDIFSQDSVKGSSQQRDSSGLSLALDQIKISEGTIEYKDESRDLYFLMKDVNYLGAGDFQQEVFDFRTKTNIGQFTMDYGKVRYFSKKEVEIDLVMEVDLEKNIYTMKDNVIRINHFKFDLKGNLALLDDGEDFNLQFATQETDFKNIISLVPGIFMKDFEEISTQGELKFDGYVKGQHLSGKNQIPSFLGRILISDGIFKIDTLPDPIEHIQMELEISNKTGIRDSMVFDLKNFQFYMRNHPVRGRIKVQGLDHLKIDADVFADIDLAELEKMYPIRGVKLRGKVDFELKAKGPFEFDGEDYRRIPSFYLNMRLSNGKLKYDHLPAAIDSIHFHLVAENKTGVPEQSFFDLRSIHLDMGKNIVHGFAKLEGYKNLKIKTDIKAEMDLADIENMFPVEGTIMKGHISLDAEADGNYNKAKNKFPSIDARVELKNGFFQTRDYPDPMENVHLSGEIVNTSGNFADTRMTINRLTYSLEDEPFEVKGTISDLVSYKYDLKIKGLVDLKKIAKIYPITGLQLEGIIISDVEINGTLADLEAGLYERTFSNGQIEIKDLLIQNPSIRKPIRVRNALFSLTPTKIVLEKFNGKMGRSNISMSGDLFNYMSFVTRNNDLVRCDLNLKCDTLDVNEWLGEENLTTIDNTPVNKINVWQVPTNLDLVFDSEIDYVLYEDMKISTFDGEIRMKDGIMRLHETGFNSLNAKFSFSGDYDTRDSQHPLIDVDLDIKDLDIEKAYKEMKLVRQLLPAAGDAEGRFSITYKLKGELAQDFSPKLETLKGGGTMRIAEAKFNGMKIFEEISKASKKDEVNDPHLKDFVMRTEIRDNKIYVKPFSLKVSGFNTDVEGVSDISGSLRYLVKIELLPFKIKTPFHVTGTYDNPKVTLGKGYVLVPGDSILNR